MLIAFGYEPHVVEQEWGIAEFEMRFMDCLKLMRRQQQLQASTLLSAVGSLFVKKGEKTFFESIDDDIKSINIILGETGLPKQITIESEGKGPKKWEIDAMKIRESFMNAQSENRIKER